MDARSVRWLSRVLLPAALFAAAAGAPRGAEAQNLPATIAGQVTDETGGLLPGVTVVLKEAKTGRERVVVTDGVGRFVADQLVPGSYTVTASLAGFRHWSATAWTSAAARRRRSASC